VLILRHRGSRVIPGGAGNAVLNLHALGATPLPVAVVGAGDVGSAVARGFEERGIDASGIVRDRHRATIRKTRVMAGGPHGQKQQILRIDQDEVVPPGYFNEAGQVSCRAGRCEGAGNGE